MPKRTTTTFTSEDAPETAGDNALFVYFCRFTGEHCLITDVRLNELPRRRTDGAYIIDTQNQLARMQAAPQPPRLLKRGGEEGGRSSYEKQFRYTTRAELPFAYRTEPEGRYLYVLPDALTSFASDEVPEGGVPVPPCIQLVTRGAGETVERSASEATRVALSIEERSKAVAVLRISADDVSVSVTGSAQHSGTIAELLDLFSRVLGCKHANLYLNKGWSDRSKMLLVRGIGPQHVHGKLTAWIEAEKERGRQ